MNLQEEKRQWYRVDRQMSIDVQMLRETGQGDSFQIDPVWTRDVSGNGVGLITRQSCLVGSKVGMRFRLPDRHDPIEASGTVVWSQLEAISGVNNQYRVGIVFDDMAEPDRNAVLRFVEKEALTILKKRNK